MKKLMLFAMWLGASAAAVGVAWAGVSVVDNQVVDPPSAAEVVALTPSDAASSSSENADHSLSSPGEPGSTHNSEPGNTPGSVEVDGSSPPTQATPSNPTPTTQPASSPTIAPTAQPAPTTQRATTTPPTTSAPTAPPPPSPAATTQTFALTGGTAAISFSASGVEVLWATPNPGFSVEIEPGSPGIKVEFRADHHRSRVDAWWFEGPQHSVREEPRG